MNLKRYRLKLTYHLRRMDIYMRRAILGVILYIIFILCISRWAEFHVNSQFTQTSCETNKNLEFEKGGGGGREATEWSNLWMTEKNDKFNEHYFVSLSRSLIGQTLNRLQKLSLTPQHYLEIMAIRGILESYQEPANRKESSKLRMEIGHLFSKWKEERVPVSPMISDKTIILQKVNAILNLYTIYSLRNMREVADKCAILLLEIRNALISESKSQTWETQLTNNMLASWVQDGSSLASLTSDTFDVAFIHHVFSAVDIVMRDSIDLSGKQIDEMRFVHSLNKVKSLLPSQLHQIIYYDLDEYNYDLRKWPTVVNETFASPSWLLLHRNVHLGEKHEPEPVDNTNNKENNINNNGVNKKEDNTHYEVFQDGPVSLNNRESRYEDFMLNVWLLSLQETKSVLSKKKPEQILSRNKEKLRTHYDNVIVSIVRYLVRRIWSKDKLPESVKSYLEINTNKLTKKKRRQWEEQDVKQEQQVEETEKECKINYTTVGMWVERVKDKPYSENKNNNNNSVTEQKSDDEFTSETSTLLSESESEESTTPTTDTDSAHEHNAQITSMSKKDDVNTIIKERAEREFMPIFDYSACGFAATLARGARWNAHRYASRKNALIYNNEEILAVAESMASSCYLLWFTNIRENAQQSKLTEKESINNNVVDRPQESVNSEEKTQTFVQGWEFDLFGTFRAITSLENLSHSTHQSKKTNNIKETKIDTQESACKLTNLLLRSFYELFETTWDTEYAEMAYHLLSRANEQCLPTSFSFFKESEIETPSDKLPNVRSAKEINADFVSLYLRNLRLFTLLVTRMECTMQRRSKSFCALPQYVILGEYDQLIPLATFYGKHKF